MESLEVKRPFSRPVVKIKGIARRSEVQRVVSDLISLRGVDETIESLGDMVDYSVGKINGAAQKKIADKEAKAVKKAKADKEAKAEKKAKAEKEAKAKETPTKKK